MRANDSAGFVALGSNVGDRLVAKLSSSDRAPLCRVASFSPLQRLRHLSRAVLALRKLEGLRLVSTCAARLTRQRFGQIGHLRSSLYSTKAQYVSDQPAFLNAAP